MPDTRQNEWREYALVTAVLGALTGIGLLFPARYSLSVGLLYLLALILLSLRVGRWPMLLGGLLSAGSVEYFFLSRASASAWPTSRRRSCSPSILSSPWSSAN